jgi:hypothetical protein
MGIPIQKLMGQMITDPGPKPLPGQSRVADLLAGLIRALIQEIRPGFDKGSCESVPTQEVG